MQLNMNTPTSNIAFLGNEVSLSAEKQQARPVLNTATPQAKSLLLGIYLNLLRSYVPSYAVNSWSNPTTGFGQSPFAVPINAQQQAFYSTARQYTPLIYPQYAPQYRPLIYPQYTPQINPQYYPIIRY